MMISIIAPHGAINETVVTRKRIGSISRVDGIRYFLIDDDGNSYGISETTFAQLKNNGYKEVTFYEIRNR